MGVLIGGLSFKEAIIHYYLFQKKLLDYFYKKNQRKDENILQNVYIIHPDWIDQCMRTINYEKIKEYLDGIHSIEKNLELNKVQIEKHLSKYIEDTELNYLSQVIKTDYFDITQQKIFDKKFLINIMPEAVYTALKINEKNTKIKVKYLLKEKMIIFGIEDFHMIKIIIIDTAPYINNKKVVNLTWEFYNDNIYDDKLNFLRNNNSDKIFNYFLVKDIFGEPLVIGGNKNNKRVYELINEDFNQNPQNVNKIINNNPIIINPQNINFNMTKRPSFKGLDNVGDNYNMNSTLQCLANIKPITDYLLKPEKYSEIFNNQSICPLTIQYCQVLLALYCDNSNIGSFSPQQFKNILNKMIPLFQGVQVNNSGDLILFLLEALNSELSKLHNKRLNIKKSCNKNNQIINTCNENEVLNEFVNKFNYNYCSVIGENLYGFKKCVLYCKYCSYTTYNFNIFNTLIFNLKETANYFKINNNGMFPIIAFGHCFNFLLKNQFNQGTFCQNCKTTGNIIYKENLYSLPNYLIIILNRGKGNIFNCKVDIPEIFDSSNYEETTKNKKYELIGIISYFGQNNNMQHSIAFCKHNMDNSLYFTL